MRSGTLAMADVPIPKPGPREVLVKTLACGICGSDLHCVTHGKQLLASTKQVTGGDLFGFDEPVVLGHEFCAEVAEHGPGCRRIHAPGSRVVSAPFLLRDQPVNLTFGNLDTPGGFAEYMVLSEDLLIPVPSAVPSDVATLAEPFAVALHAVNRGDVGHDHVPIVIGCGPIGLAVIAVLKMRGIGPIVAADFSRSRRAMARDIGADVVVDPRETSPYDSWKAVAAAPSPERQGRQTLTFGGFPFRPSVIFECVGVPGIIQQILAGAAPCSKIVVAGVCMERDSFYPTFALMKEVDISFCLAYTMEEYAEAFDHVAAGRTRIDTLITSRVGLGDVKNAFTRLADPEQEAKIIIVP
jgi:threonine dehydrogenase-like Zn-dependent dehydrogenase